jgi:Flp pilus assembly protein TadG
VNRRAALAPATTRATTSGQALVEFAFVLPIFLVMALLLLDFGRVVYAQHTITQDAREAVRNAAVQAAYTQAKYDEIRAVGMVMSPGTGLVAEDITGDTSEGCAAAAASLSLTGPDDSTSPSTCFYPGGSGDRRIEINISVDVPLITPVIANIMGGSYTVTAKVIGYVQSSAE